MSDNGYLIKGNREAAKQFGAASESRRSSVAERLNRLLGETARRLALEKASLFK